MDKIIRSLCWFSDSVETRALDGISQVTSILSAHGYTIQTRRICFRNAPIKTLDSWCKDRETYLGVGTLKRDAAWAQLEDFFLFPNVSFNLDATEGVNAADLEILLRIISQSPESAFRFAYTFNNRPSSPFFPSADMERPGFSVGLQPTDLSENCTTLEQWLSIMREVWSELARLLGEHPGFLGIDSSVAPLFQGKSSLIHFVKRLSGDFSRAVTTDLFVRISEFIAAENPRPVGLCGLMLPCLEDFELAEEYERGQFSVERNLFLSLHSGLGIDTYPIGVDEDPERILQVLRLLQRLSAKYHKTLSARFVSDGKAKIGEMTAFHNPFLKDVKVRPL